MKSLLTTLIFLLLSLVSFCQEFAPLGAKWHVETFESFSAWKGTLTNESIGDTIIKGLGCKVIYKSQATVFNEIVGSYILCQSNDSIYHFIPELDTLNLVMDFGANPGESWETFDRANEHVSFGLEFNHRYQVDSVSYIFSENSDSVKVQHLSVFGKTWQENDSEYSFRGNSELIQYIGFKKALLPINDGDGFTDDIAELNVRCYRDDAIGLIKLTDGPSCSPSSNDNVSLTSVNIYPNPSKDVLNLEGINKNSISGIKILNNKGIVVKNEMAKNQIDISQLASGMYYIQFINGESSTTRKFIILR